MRRTRVKQHDSTDCGAACLASVCSYYGLRLPLSRIRLMAGTDERGTSLMGLLEAAKELGFDAKGVKGNKKSLFKIPKPSIAHVTLEGHLYHYVVIYRVNRKFIQIMDPSTGKLSKMKWAEFLSMWQGILVLLFPTESFREGNEHGSVWNWFWLLLKPHKSILLQAVIGSLLFTLLGFSTSIFIRLITDNVLSFGNPGLLNTMGIAMLLILVIQLALSVFKDLFVIRTGQQIDARLVLGYQRHLFRLSQRFFDTMKVGEIISRVGDALKIRIFISHIAMSFVVNAFIVLFSFAIVLLYYWKLGLFLLSMVPMYLIVFQISDRLNRSSERKVMEASASLESHLVESLQGIRTLKQFGIEDFVLHKTEVRFLALLKCGYRSSLNQVFAQSSSFGIQNLFSTILLWIGSYYVLGAQITIGELMSVYAILGYMTGPISSLVASNKSIQNAMIAADRLFEITGLKMQEKVKGAILNQNDSTDVLFERIVFKYDHRGKILDGFSALIRSGEITAIVGESGSGKSTLLLLLQRLYPVQSGCIKIGGINLKYISDQSLKEMISVVPQQVELFSGTVAENIALGDPGRDLGRILELVDLLEMEEFLEALENGIHTFIGESGRNLSGGQKQRIAMARALYRDPKILLLDEPTSSLDKKSEKAVIRVMRKLKNEGKTVIVISHRPSTIAEADRILTIDQGRRVNSDLNSDFDEASKNSKMRNSETTNPLNQGL